MTEKTKDPQTKDPQTEALWRDDDDEGGCICFASGDDFEHDPIDGFGDDEGGSADGKTR